MCHTLCGEEKMWVNKYFAEEKNVGQQKKFAKKILGQKFFYSNDLICLIHILYFYYNWKEFSFFSSIFYFPPTIDC